MPKQVKLSEIAKRFSPSTLVEFDGPESGAAYDVGIVMGEPDETGAFPVYWIRARETYREHPETVRVHSEATMNHARARRVG